MAQTPEKQPVRKLKVLHTMTWLAPGGGADKNVYHTVKGLIHEYDIHFTTGMTIFRNDFKDLPGLPIHYCKYMVRPIHPVRDLQALWWYYKLCKREKFDIVHTHETKSSFIVKLSAWLAGVPIIIYGLHGVAHNDPLSRAKRLMYIWLERLTIWTSDLIVSVSQSSIDEYHKANIGRKIPYEIVYSGIDVREFREGSSLSEDERNRRRAALGIAPTDRVLINIGRFSFSKAQRYTIEAFARLKKTHADLKLLLVGDGELLEECKAQVKELGLTNDVIFYGFTDDVAGVITLADINVLTSLREGLPRVVVEAALCKRPTVAFEVEGIHEIIANGQSGYVVPQYDVAGLAEGIEELLNDPDKRRVFADKVFAHAMAKWDVSVMLNQLRAIYTRLAKQKLKLG